MFLKFLMFTKEFCQAMYNKSRLRNKFCKVPTKENGKLFLSQSVKKALET